MRTYKEQRETLNQALNLQYMNYIMEGKKEEAYEVVKLLMRFRFITKADAKVSKKSMSDFAKAGIDTEPKLFEYDVRRSDGHLMIPDNIYLEPRKFELNVNVGRHWMRRAEHQYVGEQICDEHVVEYDVRRENYSGGWKNKFENFKQLVKKYNGKDDFKNYSFEDGEYHIWETHLAPGSTSHVTSLGYVVTHFEVGDGNKAKPIVEVCLDTDVFLKNKFDILNAFAGLEASIKASYAELEYKDIKFIWYNDYSKIGKKQRLEREIVPTPDEYVKIKQEQDDKAALEEEAFTLHMSVEDLMAMKAKRAAEEAKEEKKK